MAIVLDANVHLTELVRYIDLNPERAKSGFRTNQLLGQSMALGKIITYHKVGESFIGDFCVGGSLETGNV